MTKLGSTEDFEIAQSQVEAHFYALKDEIAQLRGNLSLAEEGLANATLEIERLQRELCEARELIANAIGGAHEPGVPQIANEALREIGALGDPVEDDLQLRRLNRMVDKLKVPPEYLPRVSAVIRQGLATWGTPRGIKYGAEADEFLLKLCEGSAVESEVPHSPADFPGGPLEYPEDFDDTTY